MYKALVLGCGNIGALYDFDNEKVLTHAKGYFVDPDFSLAVFDTDPAKSSLVADKYKCDIIHEVNASTLSNFDCLSICTPTVTHFKYLSLAIEAKVKLLICEKPVSNLKDELQKVKLLYQRSQSNILVNYFRRFQPAYSELKQLIDGLKQKEQLTNIAIRYQRGFINNCSHAFDLVEFITGEKLKLEEIKLHNEIKDHFVNDPTVSLQAMCGATNISICGLSNVKFSHFEIDLYFEYHKVALTDAGHTITVFKADKSELYLQPLIKQKEFNRTHALADYMRAVIHHAKKILKAERISDNFINSVELNERMLNYIKN